MAESPKKIVKEDAKLYHDTREEKLCKRIVETLGNDGPQRVVLSGEAGIGKTRLAKKVAKYVMDKGLSFTTISLHLNNKFDDEWSLNNKFDASSSNQSVSPNYKGLPGFNEWSLYQNIASQLSVYSDFEETEVDDRDEEEEEENKTGKELLDELKKKISNEIQRKVQAKKDEAKKKRDEEAKKKKEEEEAKRKEDKTKAKAVPGDKKAEENDITETSYLLLILDDDGKKTSEMKVMTEFKLEAFLKEQEFLKDNHERLKILVTRRKGDEDETTKTDEKAESEEETKSPIESPEGSEGNGESYSDEEIKSDEETNTQVPEPPQAPANDQVTSVTSPVDEPKVAKKYYDEIEYYITDESKALHDSIKEDFALEYIFLSLTSEEWKKAEDTFITDKAKESKGSPAAIALLAKSLKQISESVYNPGKEKIEDLIKDVLSAVRPDSGINPILHLSYVLLDKYGPSNDPTFGPSKDTVLDCFWHSLDFFEKCGCAYYREMITQWILEGYFDPVRSVEKAYEDGHSILMELINRGMLKIQENNVVVPEMSMSCLLDPRPRGHLGRSRLAFSRVYVGDKNKGIGKITQIDDMVKTVQAKKGDKVTTILVSGDRLRRVTPNKYFKKLNDLEVLGLFEPTLEPFINSFKDLTKLRVLVIRDCDLLDEIEELKTLRGLHALEVSGASSLTEIKDDFFKALSKLQSLHLSKLNIKSSPSSISLLKELHCLIIRDCPLLEDLPDIQELENLEIVDISGAHGLQTCFDNTKGEKKNKSKNKNFYHLTKLQLLDFSESKIERLPIFQDSAVADKLHSVTRLLLRDCSKLRRLPSLKPLSGLQILDLSGTSNLVEMLEVCFEDKKELKYLNLSRSNLGELATTIDELSGLTELLLKDCKNLDAIPDISKLRNLEVIDVSGCTKLEKIEGSFKDMSYLREVNLFGTKVKTPELPSKSKSLHQKRIILEDGTLFVGENWVEVRKSMESKTSEASTSNSSSSVVKPQEISETSDITEKKDVIGERLLQVPTEKEPYKKIKSQFVSENEKKSTEIRETNEFGGEELAKAEFISFVDVNSTRLKSILNETKSVKGCSLKMCMDIKDLFSEVEAESLESIDTLTITNLPFLETISCGDKLKSLKKLSIDCCPNIKVIFSEAAQLPSSLEEVDVKYCEKLEEVVKGVELSTLTNMKFSVDKESCPNYKGIRQDSDWVLVDHNDALPQA